MKQLTAFVLAFTILFLFMGCQANTAAKDENVMKAWSGEFSEEKLKSAINEYKKNYTTVTLEKGGKSSISFVADVDVSSCSISRLSHVDDTNIEVELHSYIYLFIKTNCDGRTVTIPLDWWYTGESSWVNNYLVWSYLVHVKDVNGGSHYYYFRVDYSDYAQ